MKIKRWFDFFIAVLGLTISCPVLLLSLVAARFSTGKTGLFVQKRIGLGGRAFNLFKIRSMKDVVDIETTVTAANDPRITTLGWFLRKSKIDELPQLWNVLQGDMSLVGPRPDVPEVIQALAGEDKKVLSVRPGITGPATLKYRDEEQILSLCSEPEKFNQEVIFPDKVKLNKDYVLNWSFRKDLIYLWQTFTGGGPRATLASLEKEYVHKVA